MFRCPSRARPARVGLFVALSALALNSVALAQPSSTALPLNAPLAPQPPMVVATTLSVSGERATLDAGRSANVGEGDWIYRVLSDGARVPLGPVVQIFDRRSIAMIESAPEHVRVLRVGERVEIGPPPADVSDTVVDSDGEANVRLFLEPGASVRASTCDEPVLHPDRHWDLDVGMSLTTQDARPVVGTSDRCGVSFSGGARFEYTVPPDAGGSYLLRVSGHVSARVQVSSAPRDETVAFRGPAARRSAVPALSVRIPVFPGSVIEASTCDSPGAGRSTVQLRGSTPDTVLHGTAACAHGQRLRFYNGWDSEVRWLHVTCDGDEACSGQLRLRVRNTSWDYTPPWQLSANARGWIGVTRPGQGMLGDASLAYRAPFGLTVRLEGLPLGVSSGNATVTAVWGAHALVGWGGRNVEFAVGAGAASSRSAERRAVAPIVPELLFYGRLGTFRGLLAELHLGAVPLGNQSWFSGRFALRARLPPARRKLEYLLRGALSWDGHAFADTGVLWWVAGTGAGETSLGLSLTAGVAGVVGYACQGALCVNDGLFLGPSLGFGVEVRP